MIKVFFKNIPTLFLFIIALLCPHSSFAQNEACKEKLNLAKNYYDNGEFILADGVLNQFQTDCGKSSDYYKLRTKIAIVTENIDVAKKSMALYIQSKAGNFLSDDDPRLFKNLYDEVRDSLSSRVITSLSKKAEDVDLAAATVVVIKAEEFENRGYNDLIDLLSDQPGFDISKIQSAFYANVFQRGFRQENTERTLLLIDGVEENDVWSNVAYISRQYPLSNISAVEIVYGPASTIYGARAFAGAINIVTKSALNNKKTSNSTVLPKSMKLGVSAKGLVGTYNSKGCDLNISGKNSDVSFSMTGRVYKTDGNNLSETSFYDYKKEDIDNLFYNPTKLSTLSYIDNSTTTTNEVANMVNRFKLVNGADTNRYFAGYGTGTLTVNPDSLSALINKARQIDKDNYLKKINGSNVGYSNNAYNYFLSGKLSFDHFTVGFRTWKNHEGFNYYQDLYEAGSKNGNVWAPKNTTFYSVYDRQFENISITNSSSYVINSIDKESALVNYNSFFGLLTTNSFSNLNFLNILFPDSLIDGNKHGWRTSYYYYKARQFRNDLKINYSIKRLNIISGMDFRNSQLQGDYLQYKMYATEEAVDQSKVALAQELGVAYNQDKGGNQYNTLDFGLYSQATYKVIDSLLYLTAGGRYDYNLIRTSGGYGGIFNPKLAAICTVKKLIFKAIYSQGIQNASSFTKYSTFTTRNANPNLKPERIKNIELVMQNRHGSKLYFDVSGFFSIINNAISSAVDPEDPEKQKNQNSGAYVIKGCQGTLNYALPKTGLTFMMNATLTQARQTQNKLEPNFAFKTIGDIAPLKSNLNVNYHKRLLTHDFNFNLRVNYVSAKLVGTKTTVPLNTGLNNSNNIPGYSFLAFTLNYKNTLCSYLSFHFTVNNLLNSNYYSPGPRTANGNYTSSYNGYVPYVPQQGRNFLFTINLDL